MKYRFSMTYSQFYQAKWGKNETRVQFESFALSPSFSWRKNAFCENQIACNNFWRENRLTKAAICKKAFCIQTPILDTPKTNKKILEQTTKISFQKKGSILKVSKIDHIYYLLFAGELCKDRLRMRRSSKGWDFSKVFKDGASKSSMVSTSIPPAVFCKMPSTWFLKKRFLVN